MSNKKTISIVVTLIVVIALIAGGIYLTPKYLNSPISTENEAPKDINVIATVDDDPIYLKEYTERLSASVGAGASESLASVNEKLKEPVLNDLVDLKIIEKELAKRNMSISDEELTAAAKKDFKYYDRSSQEVQRIYRDFVRLKVGRDKLLSAVVTWKEGYVLFCRYDRAYVMDMKDKAQAASKLLAKQEPYAKSYCQKAKSRLESGQSDFAKELKDLKADKVIGDPAWKPYGVTFGNEFDKDFLSQRKSGGTDLSFLDQLDQLDYKKPGYYMFAVKEDPSKRQGAIAKDVQSAQSGPRDVMTALVYLDGKGNTGETTNFDEWMASMLKKYNVKKYPERIKV